MPRHSHSGGAFLLGDNMDINLNFGLNTKVDAINRVLDSIGSVGINSEEEIDWNIDASTVDKLIDAMSQNIQINAGKGWWFNREEFHKFTPDPINGFISVPNNTLACYVKRQSDGSILPVSLRGNQLFEASTNGYDMSSMVNSAGVVDCILVVNLPFDYIPASAKQAITDAARFWLVNDTEGDQIKLASLKQAADASYSSLMSENASQRRRNMFNNKYIAGNINRAGGYNNN